ncbi:hypothetical protein ACFL3S_09470 [Gemmatimonadota bacterium]
MIRREEDRVWLDLDELYPVPHQHPNTVFKSMAIAFQAMGDTTTYVDLMGLSAAAFRIQVGGALCPSSPHPHLGFSCAALAREALGYRFVEHEWEPKSRHKTEAVRAAVVKSIDRGAPVLTAEEETGLVVGYVAGGEELLFREPYSKKGDPPAVLGDTPLWGLGVIDELPKKPGRDSVVKSLEVAVELAHTTELFENSYASGFTAYERWISNLLDDSFIPLADMDAGAILLGNAHIYYCLVDARRCASAYLEKWKGEFPVRPQALLDEAATHYAGISRKLDAGWDSVPWPRQLKAESDWTEEHRKNQASLLSEVLVLEKEAIAGIEEALRGME